MTTVSKVVENYEKQKAQANKLNDGETGAFELYRQDAWQLFNHLIDQLEVVQEDALLNRKVYEPINMGQRRVEGTIRQVFIQPYKHQKNYIPGPYHTVAKLGVYAAPSESETIGFLEDGFNGELLGIVPFDFGSESTLENIQDLHQFVELLDEVRDAYFASTTSATT